MSNDFSKAKIGDRVYHLNYGYGNIDRVKFGSTLPIRVTFTTVNIPRWFTTNGKTHSKDETPMIYWDKPEIIAPPEPARYKNVNGFKVPDVAISTVEDHEKYYIPSLTRNDDWCYGDYIHIESVIQAGCVYTLNDDGRNAAIVHRNAWLGIGELWEDEE